MGDYRYNDELSMVFMSCNLIGGMFQRLEKLNKNAFASACVFGENDNNTISHIWVFKGHKLAFDLNEDWQTDYGKLAGLITIKDFDKSEKYPLATKDEHGRLR